MILLVVLFFQGSVLAGGLEEQHQLHIQGWHDILFSPIVWCAGFGLVGTVAAPLVSGSVRRKLWKVTGGRMPWDDDGRFTGDFKP